jgi:hypothetical protein
MRWLASLTTMILLIVRSMDRRESDDVPTWHSEKEPPGIAIKSHLADVLGWLQGYANEQDVCA